MNDERWLPISGYEGAFEVSDAGRVRSLDRTIVSSNGHTYTYKGSLRQLVERPTGYLQVMVGVNSHWRAKLVHALVLEAFVSPRPDGMVTRHLNGVRDDNRLSNLAWGTPSENSLDMVEHGTHNNGRKTHCKNGHEFTAENTTTQSMGRGGRLCRQCKRDEWHRNGQPLREARRKGMAA